MAQIINMTDFVTIVDNEGTYHRFNVIDDENNNEMLHRINCEGQIQGFAIYNKNCCMEENLLDHYYFAKNTPIKTHNEYISFIHALAH